jgi:DNA repair protein RecO (recombination protein O)
MKQITTKAIVLARTDFGEADRIITFLSTDQGKVRAIAKGVRKQKSKLAGGIELFSISDITFIKGRGEIDTLVSARLFKHYGNIVKDIERTMLGYEILKIINKVLEDEGGTEYFKLLNESLAALDNSKTARELSELSFLMRLMKMLGHLPNLEVAGSDKNYKAFSFNIETMSFLASKDGQFSLNHIKLMRLLTYNSPAALVAVKDAEKYLRELAPLVRNIARQYVVTF